jgi:hypothetical protein
MDTFVHDDPNPIPPPNPAKALRAPLAPPRAKTTPAKLPTTRPVVVHTIISSKPFFIVDDTTSSEEIVGDDEELSLILGKCEKKVHTVSQNARFGSFHSILYQPVQRWPSHQICLLTYVFVRLIPCLIDVVRWRGNNYGDAASVRRVESLEFGSWCYMYTLYYSDTIRTCVLEDLVEGIVVCVHEHMQTCRHRTYR